MGWPARAAWVTGTMCAVSLGWVMRTTTDAALPFADSAIAGASITAQFLLSFRKIENWVLWVLIDVASVALYLNRGLNLFASALRGVWRHFGYRPRMDPVGEAAGVGSTGFRMITICFHGAESTGKSGSG